MSAAEGEVVTVVFETALYVEVDVQAQTVSRVVVGSGSVSQTEPERSYAMNEGVDELEVETARQIANWAEWPAWEFV